MGGDKEGFVVGGGLEQGGVECSHRSDEGTEGPGGRTTTSLV